MNSVVLEKPSVSLPASVTPSFKNIRSSVWVLIGYSFWLGFFIGAVIMHAIIKSV
jgi:hypothetical protein